MHRKRKTQLMNIFIFLYPLTDTNMELANLAVMYCGNTANGYIYHPIPAKPVA